MLASLRAKVRSQIRRPVKEGMTARISADQLASFYHVFSRNMRDLGTPVLPRAFFERISRVFAREFVVGVVYRGERAVAAGAGFVYRDEFEITWASSLREFNASAPNMLLYWSLIEEMIRRGIRRFNFGRCTPGEGTHRFKQQWGGVDEPLPWRTWPDDSGAVERGPGRVTRILSAAWQRLPMPIAERIGPPVARQLPWW
jgi:lipid II:glycine glycyltransferase (peptidoglycan interpeptide bridge formation enzyme)